jgi:prepilin-type processing-associated H-X9-DG protein
MIWLRRPVTRHGDGTTFSFMDGHADYHKWRGIDTIKVGRDQEQREWGVPLPAGHGGGHRRPPVDAKRYLGQVGLPLPALTWPVTEERDGV